MKFILFLLLSFPAFAHDDAQWIADGKFLDRFNIGCCGPTDCFVVKPGEMTRIENGWMHNPTKTILKDTDVGNYRSIDTQMWRCVRGDVLTCVFTGEGI